MQWTRIQNRDENATYNRWERSAFATQAPGFDWDAWFREAGYAGQQTMLVAQPSTFTASARIIGQTPQAVLNDYLLLRVLDRSAPLLSSAFVNANFAFRGTVLNGTPEIEPRWKRGVQLVTGASPPRRSAPPTSWSATSSTRWTAASPI